MRRGAGFLALVLFAPFARAAEEPPPATSSYVARTALGTALEAGDAKGVDAAASLLAAMGGGLSDASQQRIAPLLPPERREALKQRFAENVAPIAASIALGEIPAEHRLVEGIAYDPAQKRLLATTVVDGRLLVQAGQAWRRVALPQGIGGLFGMAIDGARRRLWISVGLADPVADRAAIAPGVLEMDADSLELLDLKTMPAGSEGSPGDVAIAADGTVYVSDGLKGGLYRCVPGCTMLSELLPPGRIRGPQGMVPTRDGKALIVASYGQGLARVDIESGAISWLSGAEPLMLDGIDGLVRDGTSLVAIQNGINPRRIVRIRLDEAERAVAGVDVLERANPAWGEPTLGAIADGRLVYVADGQWEVWGEGGRVQDGRKPRATAIRALPLR